MAKYTFRIHKVTQVNEGQDGWLRSDGITGDKITSIPDSLVKSTDNRTGKIGTSIPTPLARIYLFKTAYKVLSDAQVEEFEGAYAELVSDSLDLLQLLFEKGNDSDINVYTWDRESKIQELATSDLTDDKDKPHELLAESLKMAFDSANFDSQMTLIEYKGILMGGLSPFTLVYTSANLRRQIEEKRRTEKFDCSSNKKVDFFGVKPVRLKDRSPEFQAYVCSLISRYPREMANANSSFQAFVSYIKRELGRDPFEIDNQEQFEKTFEEDNLKFEKPLEVGGVCLRWNNKMPELDDSYFMMAPTSTEYKNFGIKATPLVLPKKFTTSNCRYIDSAWNANTHITLSSFGLSYNPMEFQGLRIGGRYLPKNGGQGELSSMKYPWVSNADFFYDDIINLGYALDKDKYCFANVKSNLTDGDVSFLLPIRREYFLFFTIEDLKKNLTITAEYEKGQIQSLSKVKVELKIPLKGNKNLTLERVYEVNSADGYGIQKMNFGMGVFPFYQLAADSDLKNQYSVYIYKENDNKKLNFKFYPKHGLDTAVNAEGVKRTTAKEGESIVYSLRNQTTNTFDFIEVVAETTKNVQYGALLIPNWNRYESEHNSLSQRKTILSLDFGTSNTHISYLDPETNKPKSFSIGKEDMQMVLLNKPYVDDGKTDYRHTDSFGDISVMTQYLREFVPSVIGKENIHGVEYPVKTAALHSAKLNDEDVKLFGNANIGYDVNNEVVTLNASQGTYRTDLKWAAQTARENGYVNGVEQKLIDAYCEQTLWMLKNMIVNKGYYKELEMVYFYPASMEREDRDMFEEAWRNAIEKIFENCGFKVELHKPELESVAPYYSLLNESDLAQKLYAYNSINIDIGGGTTDVFILEKLHTNPETQEQSIHGYEASVQFAGDNLWGGPKPVGNTRNGFVTYMDDCIKSGDIKINDAELKDKYDSFKGRLGKIKETDVDKDIASFFFKHEAFRFGEKISSSRHLKKVLLVHYASIIYYVVDMIKHIKKSNPTFVMPCVMTFTGKGSEYIKLLTSKTDTDLISDLTYDLFIAFGIAPSEFEKHGFSVSYTKNPKVLTAEGGIHRWNDKNNEISITFQEKKQNTNVRPNAGDSRSVAVFEKLGESLLGFEQTEETPYANKVKSYKDKVMAHFDKFIDTLCVSSKDISSYLRGVSFEKDEVAEIKKFASLSYDTLATRYENRHKGSNEKLESNLFFLAMSNMIVDYSNKQKACELETKNKK